MLGSYQEMCVCLCVCVCVYIYIYIYIYIITKIKATPKIHIYTYPHIHACPHIHDTGISQGKRRNNRKQDYTTKIKATPKIHIHTYLIFTHTRTYRAQVYALFTHSPVCTRTRTYTTQVYLKESDEAIENKLHKKIKAERDGIEQRKKAKEEAAAAAAAEEAAKAAAAQATAQMPMLGLGMTQNHPALYRPPGTFPVMNTTTPMPGTVPVAAMGNGLLGMGMVIPAFAEPLDHFPPRGEYCKFVYVCVYIYTCVHTHTQYMGMGMVIPAFAEPLDHFPPRGEYCTCVYVCVYIYTCIHTWAWGW